MYKINVLKHIKQSPGGALRQGLISEALCSRIHKHYRPLFLQAESVEIVKTNAPQRVFLNHTKHEKI